MAVETKRFHDGVMKRRKGFYDTEAGLTIVHSEEDGCWYILYKGTALHRCPLFYDAKYICNNYYKTTEDAEQTLAIRKRQGRA